MQKLASFSIETDSVVLLKFQDGTEQRVSRRKLRQYLAAPDVQKILAAYRLRRNFLSTHMPHSGVYLLMTATAALLLGFASRPAMHVVSQIIHHQPIDITGSSPDGIIKSVPETTPAAPTATGTALATPATPAPMLAARPATHKADQRHLADRAAPHSQSLLQQVQNVVAPIATPIAKALNALLPDPTASSEPQPSSDVSASPSPTSTPAPSASPDPGLVPSL